ncbi:MAG: hypothetical protein NTZ32_25140 [Planctomycetales bacterium]|nr:hypothetical protein [Planctomycetales bacterium]
MPISPPLDRVLTSAIWCGVVCYVLTWLLHLWLKMFLRAASPFVIEGTVAAVCGGGLGVLAGAYLGKTVSRPWLRVGLCMGVMTLIPFVVVSAGVSGMIGTGWLIELSGIKRSLRANQDHRIVEFGYPLAMLVWSGLIGRGVCWYFKARHRERLFALTTSRSPDPLPLASTMQRRSVITSVWCLSLSGLGTWLVHCSVARNLGWIWGSQSSVEGAMAVFGSVLVAAVSSLYLCRVIPRPFVRLCVCAAMTIAVAGFFGLSGLFGYHSAIVLMRLAIGRYYSETVLYGYYIFPPIWAATITLGILWYDRATHGGVSMLNFGSEDGYDPASF